MEKGCFGSGVTTSDRAKIGGKDKGKSDAYIKRCFKLPFFNDNFHFHDIIGHSGFICVSSVFENGFD